MLSTGPEFRACFVPGLLQTEAYARALFRIGGLSSTRLDEKVAERMSRQTILDREVPPEIFLVLDEMVLRRMCGSPDVMGEQTEHLLTQMERPNIHVSVIPVDHGLYSGLQGGFVIADLPSSPHQADAGGCEGSGQNMDMTGARWRKSTKSGTNGGNCVEVADNLPGRVLVRDTKDRDGGTLSFDPHAWRAFVGMARQR
jgi:hypothetical protein